MNAMYRQTIEKSSSQKIDTLQVLRALAFFSIFVSHTGVLDLGLGAFGVSIFLVMSGFLMAYSYISNEKVPQNCLKFACKKMKRLYPLHICMLFLCLVYEWSCDSFTKKTMLSAVLHASLLQIWSPDESIYATLNSPAWYLCACFFCYLVFPVLLKRIRNYSRIRQAVIAIVGLVCVQVLIAFLAKEFLSDTYSDFFSMKYAVYFFPPARLLDFAIGLNLGYIYIYIYIYPIQNHFPITSIALLFGALPALPQ